MDAIDVEYVNKDGKTKTYTGFPINPLLDQNDVNDSATTLIFADDSYTAEATRSDIQGCDNSIVSFRNQGGFSTV